MILAVVWAVFLVPQVLRARAEKTPADSIGAFRNQLSVLERSTPAGTGRALARRPVTAGQTVTATRRPRAAAARRELVRRRRQNILFGLLGAMALTLVGAFAVGSLLLVHLLLDVLFVAYCALLVRARNVAAEREIKVRYLPGAMSAPMESPLLLRRAGS